MHIGEQLCFHLVHPSVFLNESLENSLSSRLKIGAYSQA